MPTRRLYSFTDSLTGVTKELLDESNLRIQLKNVGLIVDDIKTKSIEQVIDEVHIKYNNDIDSVSITSDLVEYTPSSPKPTLTASQILNPGEYHAALVETYSGYFSHFGHLLVD